MVDFNGIISKTSFGCRSAADWCPIAGSHHQGAATAAWLLILAGAKIRIGRGEETGNFFSIFDGKNRVSTVSTLEFPHSNFAVYVLFTRSHGTGLLRVAASQVEGYPGAATSGRSSTLYHPSIKSIRAPDPTVADSPASTFCIYSSF